MKVWSFLLILVIVSCSTPKPKRLPATVDTNFFFDDVDVKRSAIKLFPPEFENGMFQYYFYLQLRNNLGRYTDIEEKDIELRVGKNETLEFRLERQLRGRYYVKIDTLEELSQKELDFFVLGKLLKDQYKLSMVTVDKKTTKIKLLSNRKHRARFQLFLGDRAGKGVEIPSTPEVILEPGGIGEVEEMVHVKQGVWEFTMSYPEENAIIYINVRAHGVYLEHLYRFQHVEKERLP